jgi:hypothetical protein
MSVSGFIFILVLILIFVERRSLPETFKLFGLIRILTTDHDVITRITREVRRFQPPTEACSDSTNGQSLGLNI